MSGRIFHVIVLVFVFSTCIKAKFFKRIENGEDGIKTMYLYKHPEDTRGLEFSCVGSYNFTSYSKTGWGVFQVQTSPDLNDAGQAECAGEAEGSLTVDAIYDFYYNNVRSYCKGRKESCKRVFAFLKTHMNWVRQIVKQKAASDPIWYHVNIFYRQLKGLHTGYNEAQEDKSKKLTFHDFLVVNLQNDLDDISDALDGHISAKVKGRTKCSALIKLVPDNKDLLVAHNTWTSYVQMNRLLKRYDIPLRVNASSSVTVPGRNMSFSGYPGVITSGDDFYVTSAGLVALETTIGNSNASLWQYVQPTGQILESVRSMVALRLADSGRSWCEIFSQYNSGTYNNQWMLVDYNMFTHGKKPISGTLYVLEQIPGYIRYQDLTKVLNKQRYWPSYNTPYYNDIFDLSGNQELVEEYGDWFSYNNTARALIFKRDHSSVIDLDSLMTLMRSNNYKNDAYSKCNCTPPYTAENAIAARSDLNPKNGTYPFDALGHRCHGAIDAKVVSPTYAQNLTFVAVSGPTTGSDLPPFNWQTTDYKHLPHRGQPDSFTNFTPMVTPWLPRLF